MQFRQKHSALALPIIYGVNAWLKLIIVNTNLQHIVSIFHQEILYHRFYANRDLTRRFYCVHDHGGECADPPFFSLTAEEKNIIGQLRKVSKYSISVICSSFVFSNLFNITITDYYRYYYYLLLLSVLLFKYYFYYCREIQQNYLLILNYCCFI